MTGTELELRIARTGQEYPPLPLALIRQWITEGRVTRDDFVRPVGARNWLKVSLAPELLEESAITTEFTEIDLFNPTPNASTKAATSLPADRNPQPTRPTPLTSKPDPSQARAATPGKPVNPTAAKATGTAPQAGAATGGRAASVFAWNTESTGSAVATSLDDLGIAAPAYRRRTKKRPPLEDSVLDLTPMIDVTFQLLIFFMVTNTLSEAVPIEVPRAVYGRGVSPSGMQSILITDKSEYYLGDSVDPQALAPSLDALVDEVSKNAQAAENPLEVIISAHRESKHLDVRLLMERLGAINNMGAIRLGVEEEP